MQTNIQNNTIHVNNAKHDLLQETITYMKKNMTNFPLQFNNFKN
jgi:Uncharacterized protein conserved in bacteria